MKIELKLKGFSEKAKKAAAVVLSSVRGELYGDDFFEYHGKTRISVRASEVSSTLGEVKKEFGFHEVGRREMKAGEKITYKGFWKKEVRTPEMVSVVELQRGDEEPRSFWRGCDGSSVTVRYHFALLLEAGAEGYGLYLRPEGVSFKEAQLETQQLASPGDTLVRQKMEEVGIGLPLDKNLLPLRRIQWGRDVVVVLPEELEEIQRKGVSVID